MCEKVSESRPLSLLSIYFIRTPAATLVSSRCHVIRRHPQRAYHAPLMLNRLTSRMIILLPNAPPGIATPRALIRATLSVIFSAPNQSRRVIFPPRLLSSGATLGDDPTEAADNQSFGEKFRGPGCSGAFKLEVAFGKCSGRMQNRKRGNGRFCTVYAQSR